MTTTIAFIGLGNMGTPMAENLISAGYTLKAYDINQNAVYKVAEKGAIACQELSELEGCDVYITMLQNGAQVKQVCMLEKISLMSIAPKNALFIDCSSIDVNCTRELHAHAKELNLLYIDAPVSGGIIGAQNAQLTFMIGGDKKAFSKSEPILNILGNKLIHTGVVGTGQAAKICNNMILGISMAAISEAYALAEKLGLSKEKLFEVSSNASGQCWAMTEYSPVPGLVNDVPSNLSLIHI